MNKGELIAGMAEESGVSKADTEKVLNAFLSQVEKALCAGDKVQLTGSFLSFIFIGRRVVGNGHVGV